MSDIPLSEEFNVFVDVDHDGGGAWGTANWVKLASKVNVIPKRGTMSAEFDFHGEAEVGARRSKRTKPELTITAGVSHGNAAFARMWAAMNDSTNDGTEILHLRIVQGENVTGDRYIENDYVITDDSPNGGGVEAAQIEFNLMRAIDSPNTAVANGVIA